MAIVVTDFYARDIFFVTKLSPKLRESFCIRLSPKNVGSDLKVDPFAMECSFCQPPLVSCTGLVAMQCHLCK